MSLRRCLSQLCSRTQAKRSRGAGCERKMFRGTEDYWELRNQRRSSWWDAREGGVIKALGKRRDVLWQRRSRWKHQHGAKDELTCRSLALRDAQRCSHFWACVAADWLFFFFFLNLSYFTSCAVRTKDGEARKILMAAVNIQILQQKQVDWNISAMTQNSMFSASLKNSLA